MNKGLQMKEKPLLSRYFNAFVQLEYCFRDAKALL